MMQDSTIRDLKKTYETIEKRIASDLKMMEAIKILLEAKSVSDIDNHSKAEQIKEDDAKSSYPSKGKTKWQDYTISILKMLDKKSKSEDIIDIVVKANPEIPPKTIKSAISGTLSRAAKGGLIKAERISASLKDGNLYSTIQ